MSIPYEVQWEIDNKTCVACAYADENLWNGPHCKDCHDPINHKGQRNNFNADDPNNIIDRLIGEE